MGKVSRARRSYNQIMRKGMRLIKRVTALIMVLLLSIESFGAVVSDNDGSAFITKAEFDSLRNNFQSQIDQYNTSIDSKIDGAIASYLSGISVSKEVKIKNLIENLETIYWLSDFSLEARTDTWTSKNSNTVTGDSSTIQPDYTNFLGWLWWYRNRGMPMNYYLTTNLGAQVLALNSYWDSDTTGGATKTSTNSFGFLHYNPPLLCLCLDENKCLTEPYLFQFFSPHYGIWHFGIPYQNEWWFGLYNQSQSVLNTCNLRLQQLARIEKDYIDFKIFEANGKYSGEETLRMGSWNTEAWGVYGEAWSLGNQGMTGSTLESSNLTYPMKNYFAKTVDQAVEDTLKVEHMMLGKKSTYKMPIFFNFKLGGRTGWVGRDYNRPPTEWNTNLYFHDWSFWDSKSQTVTLRIPSTMHIAYGRVAGDYEAKSIPVSVANSTAWNINIPVNTSFKIADYVRSPHYIFNNENLGICDGIPIAYDITDSGNLRVKIKCVKKYDDITKPAIVGADAKIKFKKTKFSDSITNNYLSGTFNGSSSMETFDGTQTYDITDGTIELNVEKGDNVWLCIDPITLGQHIRITKIDVTLVTGQD